MECLFLIPWVFQDKWQSISCHILFLGMFDAAQVPMPPHGVDKIPYTLLYIAPFIASLRASAMAEYGPALPLGYFQQYTW